MVIKLIDKENKEIKMARFWKKTRIPNFQGNIRNHNVTGYANRRGKVKEIDLDGQRYVPDIVRLRDLSGIEKAAVVGMWGSEVGASAAAGYGVKKFQDPFIAWVAPGYQLGKGTLEFANNLMDMAFTGEQQQAVGKLENLLSQNSFGFNSNTASSYLDNFTVYRSASTVFDRGLQNSARAQMKGDEAAKGVTSRVPGGESSAKGFEAVHDWLLETFFAANANDPRYAESYAQSNRFKIDAYNTLKSASGNVTEEMKKTNPNIGYVVQEMQRFNKAYELLLNQDQTVKAAGVENINPSQLRAMQQQIDQIKPSQGWLSYDMVLPALAFGALLTGLHLKVVRPITRAIYNR